VATTTPTKPSRPHRVNSLTSKCKWFGERVCMCLRWWSFIPLWLFLVATKSPEPAKPAAAAAAPAAAAAGGAKKHCGECGAVLAAGRSFCGECGYKNWEVIAVFLFCYLLGSLSGFFIFESIFIIFDLGFWRNFLFVAGGLYRCNRCWIRYSWGFFGKNKNWFIPKSWKVRCVSRKHSQSSRHRRGSDPLGGGGQSLASLDGLHPRWRHGLALVLAPRPN